MSDLDPLAVHRRTVELATQACDVVKAKIASDPVFMCRVEQVSPESIVREIWAQCYRRAIEEAIAQDDDATRH